MRSIAIVLLPALLGACGSSSATDTGPTRYNFAVVDGRNQTTAAGGASLPNRITSQLTRDPQGKFSVVDFLLPTKAYAQGITLAGEPVAGAIVCGREAAAGEPQVQPLCAFTLADGKAANTVVPGTKAGTFNVVFTAQIESQEPVKDSTTVTVEPGPAVNPSNQPAGGGWDQPRAVRVGDAITFVPVIDARDQFGNVVPDYVKTAATGIAVRNGSEPGEPTPDVTGTLTYVVEAKWAVPVDGTTCSRLPCRIYVYFWVGLWRGYGVLDVS